MEDVRLPRTLIAATVAVPVLLASLFCGLYAFRALDALRESGQLSSGDLFVLLRPVVSDFIWAGIFCVWLSRRGRLWPVLAGVLTCLFLILQIVQYLAMENSTAFLTSELLAMAPIAFYTLGFEAYLMLAAVVTVTAALCIGLVRLSRSADWTWRARLATTLMLLVPLGIAWVPRGADRIERLQAEYGLGAESPVFSFGRVLQEFSRPPQTAEADLKQESGEAGADDHLRKSQIEMARRHGIFLRPKRELPFVKKLLYRQPLPFERRAQVKQPNLVLFFVESFSAAMLSPYGARSDVTPNIGRFAQDAMRVDDYLNHTAPTVAGLRGQLCSSYPVLGHGRWQVDEKPEAGRVLCMAHVLKDQGYDTVYLSHSPEEEGFLGEQVRDFGFERGLFADDVLEDLLGGERARGLLGQPDDVQVFRALGRLLRGDRLREPFFVTVSTVGTHTGQNTPKKGGYRRFKNRVRNVFFRMDAGFGTFWNSFSKTQRVGRTIVVLTGDHTMYTNDALRKAAGPRFRDDSFDYMGLLIRDPVHELPKTLTARTTSIDLAPSLLQLVGVPKNVPNPFLGRSLFSDRPAGSHGHGLIRGRKLLYWKDGEPQHIRRQDCQQKGYPCTMFPILRYALRMEMEDRLWRP